MASDPETDDVVIIRCEGSDADDMRRDAELDGESDNQDT
jgi:hypothetical protein